MKKIIAMVVSCLLVLPMALFAGCNGGGENDDEIEMWAGGQWTGDDLQNLREFINDFNADNELGFTIKLTPKAELEVSLSAALATGNAPDLLVFLVPH